MTLDPTLVASLGALILSIVGVTKFLIPDGPHQNDIVRLGSAIVGAAVFIAAPFALPGIHVTLANAASILLPAAAQGFTTGSGAAVVAKGYHLAQDKLGTVPASAPAPATPPTP